MNEDLVIEILALDVLVKTYWKQLTEGITFETEEEEMAFYDIRDKAENLLQRKLDQLPSDVREQLIPTFEDGQIKY